MNKALELAIEKVQALPPDRQDYVASVLEDIVAEGDDVYILSDEEWKLIQEGLEDADQGRIVPPSEMDAFWNRHRK